MVVAAHEHWVEGAASWTGVFESALAGCTALVPAMVGETVAWGWFFIIVCSGAGVPVVGRGVGTKGLVVVCVWAESSQFQVLSDLVPPAQCELTVHSEFYIVPGPVGTITHEVADILRVCEHGIVFTRVAFRVHGLVYAHGLIPFTLR